MLLPSNDLEGFEWSNLYIIDDPKKHGIGFINSRLDKYYPLGLQEVSITNRHPPFMTPEIKHKFGKAYGIALRIG